MRQVFDGLRKLWSVPVFAKSLLAAIRKLHSARGLFAVAGALLLGSLTSYPVLAVIVYEGSSSGRNIALPDDGTAGTLIINRPAAAKPGMAMIVSIAARPDRMNWGDPPGWTQLSADSHQPAGGISTDPGGMEMRTYYRIVDINEPNSYTWSLSNTVGIAAPYCTNPNPPSYSNCSAGGSAVGGMLVFSGIDTSTNPLDATPTSRLNASSTTHRTNAVTTATPGAVVVSMISYLSAGTFANPTCNPAVVPAPTITEALDVAAPNPNTAIGTTIQMAFFTKPTAGVTCATQSVANSNADTGVGHLLALRPSTRDLTLSMTRNVPLSPGGTASYTLTIKNDGILSDPGPLTIVNTLPAGLTYTGASGAGWNCSAAAQVVSCSKTGALAAGASATPLVINVSVNTGTSGVKTNTATAAGTGGDGNTINNTATDTYAILPTPYAYYALDEAAAWGTSVGAIPDSSGNNRGATALNTSTVPTGYPPSSPAGAARAGSPGTCGVGRIPSTAGSGMNSRIDANSLGNAGTIMFWYASSEAWRTNNRMLFDASKEFGNGNADKHFYLAKDNNGRLWFSLEDTANNNSTAQSSSNDFAANEWHHIAVTWSVSNSGPNTQLIVSIYLDGNTTPAATKTTTILGTTTLGDMESIYFGLARSANIAVTTGGYSSTNTLNGYIDEIRLYNYALTPLEIEAAYELTHACTVSVDHYEIWLPQTQSACSPTAVEIKACASPYSSGACTNLQAAVFGKTVGVSTNAGSLGASTLTFDALGSTNTTLDYPAGGNATVTLTLGVPNTAPAASNSTAIRCCPNGASATSCSGSSSCTINITSCVGGFNVVDGAYADKGYDTEADHKIYTKLAGWNANAAPPAPGNTQFQLDVVALKSSDTTKTETTYVSAAGGVKLEIIDDSGGSPCNASVAACSACAKPVLATVNPLGFAAGAGGYKNDVAVEIANTNAYSRLIARATTNDTPAVTGCSDAFSVRPRSFTVTAASGGPVSLAAPDPTETTKLVAGSTTFTLNVSSAPNYAGSAATLDASKILDHNGAPQGARLLLKNSAPPPVTLSLGLTWNADSPPTGNATVGNVIYEEVGFFKADSYWLSDTSYTSVDQSGDCVKDDPDPAKNYRNGINASGKYGCYIGSAASNYFGRFIPDHFDTEVVQVAGVPMACITGLTCPTTYNGVVYSGMPFTIKVTAKAANGAVTTNYNTTGGFSKAVTLSAMTALGGTTDAAGVLSGSSVAPADFSGGIAQKELPTGFTFSSTPMPPADIYVRAIESPGSDSVSSLRSPATSSVEGGVKVVSGRVRMENAFGSERLPLKMIAQIEYYRGPWVINSSDSITTFSSLGGHALTPGLTLTSPSGGSTASTTTPRCGVSGSSCTGGVACNSVSSVTAGNLGMCLTAPTSPVPGYVDISLTPPSYLPLTGTARAGFGLYNPNNRIIYRREVR